VVSPTSPETKAEREAMTPQEFVKTWRDVTLKERSAAQSHFNDLCRLAGHPTPKKTLRVSKYKVIYRCLQLQGDFN
jgi:hypothetical protein